MTEEQLIEEAGFKPGDVVVWVHDPGTKKVIEEVEEFEYGGQTHRQVRCVWHDRACHHEGTYPPSQLQKIEV